MKNTINQTSRILSVDVLRITAAFAVVCLHAQPFYYSAGFYHSDFFYILHFLVEKTSRFCVPFFFLAAGYFFGRSVRKNHLSAQDLFRRYFKKYIWIFVAWSGIYFFLSDQIFRKLIAGCAWNDFFVLIYDRTKDALIYHPMMTLFQGTGFHLWFLPSLIMGFGLIAWTDKIARPRWLYWIAAGLYVFGLTGGAYAATPMGFDPGFNTRNGPFLSGLFMAIGYFYSFPGRNFPSFRTALTLLIGGFLLNLIEGLALLAYGEKLNPFRYGPDQYTEYGLATVPLAMGVFFFAMARPDFGPARLGRSIGQATLGIYLSHVVILQLFQLFKPRVIPLLWDLTIAPAVFLTTALCVIAYRRILAVYYKGREQEPYALSGQARKIIREELPVFQQKIIPPGPSSEPVTSFVRPKWKGRLKKSQERRKKKNNKLSG